MGLHGGISTFSSTEIFCLGGIGFLGQGIPPPLAIYVHEPRIFDPRLTPAVFRIRTKIGLTQKSLTFVIQFQERSQSMHAYYTAHPAWGNNWSVHRKKYNERKVTEEEAEKAKTRVLAINYSTPFPRPSLPPSQ